jgi:hypothetical protein
MAFMSYIFSFSYVENRMETQVRNIMGVTFTKIFFSFLIIIIDSNGACYGIDSKLAFRVETSFTRAWALAQKLIHFVSFELELMSSALFEKVWAWAWAFASWAEAHARGAI